MRWAYCERCSKLFVNINAAVLFHGCKTPRGEEFRQLETRGEKGVIDAGTNKPALRRHKKTPAGTDLWIVGTTDEQLPMWWVDDSEGTATARAQALNRKDCWLHPRKVRVFGKVRLHER